MLTGIARYDAPAGTPDALATLGADVRAARRRRRLSMAVAAGRAGLSRDTWSRIEQGDAGVAVGTLARALEVLGLLGLLAQAALPGRDLVGLELDRARFQPRRRRD